MTIRDEAYFFFFTLILILKALMEFAIHPQIKAIDKVMLDMCTSFNTDIYLME